MRINEIFRSIQGEGLFMGCPAVFVRLQGCNLDCDWCDTKYALGEGGRTLCYRTVIRKIVELGQPGDLVVFTGGEPMLQQREFPRVIERLSGFKIHVETNGSIMPGKSMPGLVDYWAISPKLTYDFDKSYHGKRSYKKSVQTYCQLSNVQLKFVVQKQEDTTRIKDLISSLELDEIPQIIIQPERYTFENVYYLVDGEPHIHHFVGREGYLDNMEILISWCEKELEGLPWRILPQLHYLMWGGKRGK